MPIVTPKRAGSLRPEYATGESGGRFWYIRSHYCVAARFAVD